MPYGNKTGPAGYGPRTGRGLGFCNDYDAPGFANRFSGMGFGRGRGFGNNFRGGGGRISGQGFPGFRNQAFEENIPFDEKGFLNNEIEVLKKTLDTMKKRLEEIDKKK